MEDDTPAAKAKKSGPAPTATQSTATSKGDSMQERMRAVEKLVLNTAQRQRQLEAATYDFLLVPKTSSIAKAGQDEAKEYNSIVQKNGKGHGLGSPHTHIVMAMFEQVASAERPNGVEGGYKTIKAVYQYLKQQDQNTVAEVVPHCRVQETNNPDSKEAKRFKVSLSFNPMALLPETEDTNEKMCPAHARREMLEALVAEGGEPQKGAAPPPEVERAVQRQLKKSLGQ